MINLEIFSKEQDYEESEKIVGGFVGNFERALRFTWLGGLQFEKVTCGRLGVYVA